MYSASLCYLKSDGKWLMLHRMTEKNDINEGKYVGVGGKFLEGENPEKCAARRVFREIGYTPAHHCYVGVVTFVSDCYGAERIHLFLADDFAGEYHDTEEGISSWAPKEEVLKLPPWEDDRVFLPLLQRNIPFLSLRLCCEGSTLTTAKLNSSPLPLRTRQKGTEAGEVPV